MTETREPFEYDLGSDLNIMRVKHRTSGGGVWVTGTLDEFRFDALVFAEHAEYDDYELGRSRISKLWVTRGDSRQTVFNFDRGLDVPAKTDKAQAAVDFLAGGLADLVFGN